jgi:hypothetical protein
VAVRIDKLNLRIPKLLGREGRELLCGTSNAGAGGSA